MVRTVHINPVLNGFVCEVGCQKVVFTDKQSMLTALSEYYDKPEEVERRFVERAVNKIQRELLEQVACENTIVPMPGMGQVSAPRPL